jgi:hemoglobin
MSRCAAIVALASVLLAVAPRAEAALYDDMGGQPVILRIVDNATARFLADPRVSKTFSETNMDRFKKMLADQLCQLADGPCQYKGRDMTAAHRGLEINQAQFNALAEDLQDAMEEVGVGYHTQNRLMAILAPMQRNVISR